jgi:MoaA/NifB/PqqE/SkfB family radical SAM enzyme
MRTLVFEPSNLCNRSCLHCSLDKLEPRESISLNLADSILKQARALGIGLIALTGGEVAFNPLFEEMVRMIVNYGLNFNLVSNGFRFQERMLPLLTQPEIKKKLNGVSFSLDGAREASHDALRGKSSFQEVMEAATLCRLNEIPLSLKTVITNFNKGELTELALLGATLGATGHSFIFPSPTPVLIRERIIPDPIELDKLMVWISGSLARTIRTTIYPEAYGTEVLPTCSVAKTLNVDFRGNLVFCCDLSSFTGDGEPAQTGEEIVADLNQVSLGEGVSRHFCLLAKFMTARLKDADNLTSLTRNHCYWCHNYFGKFNWLKNYPESPWAEAVLDVHGSK